MRRVSSGETMRPKVLLLGRVEHATAPWKSLSSLAELVQPLARRRNEFIEECKSGALDGVVAIYRTFESVDLTGRFDRELVESLPGSVRFVCHNGAGYDQIDVPACSDRSIQVSNTPTAVNDATSDAAIFLMLGALRRFNVPMTALRKGNWRGHPPPPLGHDPEGKTLGILGMGGIGRDMKRKAEVFGIRVVYHNRNRLSKELAAGAEYVSFGDLLANSDIISINIPLNTETRHMISMRDFDQMKDGVVLVNTARGAVIDEAALVKALDSGKVASVGLDVYEQEPSIHWGLKANPNVVLLPHMGTWTVEVEWFNKGLQVRSIGLRRLQTVLLRIADVYNKCHSHDMWSERGKPSQVVDYGACTRLSGRPRKMSKRAPEMLQTPEQQASGNVDERWYGALLCVFLYRWPHECGLELDKSRELDGDDQWPVSPWQSPVQLLVCIY